MRDSLFRQGGPFDIRRVGADEYSMRIPIPEDPEGRTARECPQTECSPGYFKVKFGTAVTDEQERAYWPYCRYGADPDDFATKEQIQYAEDVVLREAHQGIERMLKGALDLGPAGRRTFGGGLFSMEMRWTPPHVRRPVEDELLRAVICPHCGLDHVVFGLATWCPDCGRDIFMTHVGGEYDVVRKMLSDVERRRQELGARIAARDIENCLEDAVSIYEAVLKALFVRARRERGMKEEEIQRALARRVRNAFQNVDRSRELIEAELGLPLFVGAPTDAPQLLKRTFEKRHPITHNLGVVDRKYLESALSAEREGREIRVTSDEIQQALDISLGVLTNLHGRLFPKNNATAEARPPTAGDAGGPRPEP